NISFIVYREKLLLSKLPVSDFISLINISESSNDKSLRMVNNRRQDSIVYIMYTSGTTGKAKGIAICDKNVISLINNPLSKISIDSSDKVLQWSNYAFDGSTYEIFGTLLSGACLYLIDTLTASDAEALSHVINSNKLSVVFITTALFNSLTEYNLSLLSSLRLLLFGGEKVSLPPVRKILSALGPDKILHVYGPTETTVYATCYPINSIPQNIETIPIGYPLCNTQIYI
ncbi:hypothetical protein B0A80_20665, partial [Flavobacterium tructae]|uniref:AMP-binding protein n=1 Tax=Flavobacterium tructae TaxID=1114873 RepID=UPI000B6922EB